MAKFTRSFNQTFSDYNYFNYPVNDHAVKLIFHDMVPGQVVKFEFANEWDPEPLRIISAKVNTIDDEKSATAITFNQQSSFEVPAFLNSWSDNIALPQPVVNDLYVYLKMENDRNQLNSAATLFGDARLDIISQPAYDHPFLVSTMALLTGIRSVATVTDQDYLTITFFGDSLTHQSFFSNPFISHLRELGLPAIGLNAGIIGNQLLKSGKVSPSPMRDVFGSAGIYRFDLDAVANQSDYILALIGLNDLYHAVGSKLLDALPTGQDLIKGTQILMERAKANNIIYVPLTLPPFKGALNLNMEAWTPEKEEIRQEVNSWIRGQDFYLDLDQIVADPDQPEYLKAAYDGGDKIHFSRRAGKEIGKLLADQFIKLIPAYGTKY